VDHPLGVGVGHRLAHLLEHPQEAQPALGRLRVLRQELSQSPAVDQLHGEERPAVLQAADLVDRRHAGVLELTGDLSLFEEAPLQVGVAAVALQQHLDRQRPVQLGVAGPQHPAHAAVADLPLDLVAPRPLRQGRGGRRGEHGVHHPGVAGEAPPVLLRRGALPVPDAVGEVHAQQLAHQLHALRLGGLPQVVLDARPAAGLPARLEAVTRLVDALQRRQRQAVVGAAGCLAHGRTSFSQVARIRRSLRPAAATDAPSRAALSAL
jgi:hypothetical protein